MIDDQPTQLFGQLWVPIGAAIIGGLLSLAGTYLALSRSHRLERVRESAIRRKEAGERAYSAFHKLQNTYNDAANLKRLIDNMFVNADRSGAAGMEPWAKVKEIVGDIRRDDVIGSGETVFLIDAKRAELLNDVHLIQKRVWNIEAAASRYNVLRRDFMNFLEQRGEDLEVGDGTKVGGYFNDQDSKLAQLQVAMLNNLVGQILESLEADVDEAFRVASEFKGASEEYFGDDFPKFGFGKAQ